MTVHASDANTERGSILRDKLSCTPHFGSPSTHLPGEPTNLEFGALSLQFRAMTKLSALQIIESPSNIVLHIEGRGWTPYLGRKRKSNCSIVVSFWLGFVSLSWSTK